jgi:hypothetical protein
LNNISIKCRPSQTFQFEKEIIATKVKKLLKNNLIRPSTSPWSVPVVLAPKKDGTSQFCVNYRKLNAVTKIMAYPLSKIDNILEYSANTRYFSTMDLASGY